MTMEDRFAILELIAKYAYTWDTKDAEGHAALFTEDAIRENYPLGASEPAARAVGHAEIRTRAQQNFTGRLAGIQTRHHQTGTIFLELHPTSAQAKTVVLVTHRGPEDHAPRPVTSGVYYDDFVKTAQGWLFSKRVLHTDG